MKLTVAALITLIMAYIAINQAYKAFEVGRAYDSAMEHIEALNRTHGTVDAAYVCRKR